MRFTAASLLAFASAVLAQTTGFDPISKPTSGEAVPAGKTYTIVWTPSTEYNGTITLSLLGGATSKTLELLSVIKSGVDNSAGEFAWAVSSSLGADATYGIEITLDSDPSILEYSFPFQITGGSAASGASSISATATESASASAAVSTSSAAETTTSSSSTKAASSSKVASTTVASTKSSSAATTLATLTSTTASSNLTTTATKGSGTTKVTSTSTKTGSTSTASSVTTSDAKAIGAAGSLITLIGGLAVAFFAL